MKRRLNRVSFCKALLCFMAFGLASPTVSAAPVISATKKDAISNDVNNDTVANPGDTLKYMVTITNSGDASGTTVQFTDTLDANTTLVAGSVKATPIAAGDNYSISGNTNLDSMFIDATNGLLANDSDPDGGPVSATPQSGAATTQGGTVNVNGDGSFEYFPKPGNSTTDTFTYTITDDEGKTDTGTASIMFPEVIWYVDSSKPNGNGTSGSPFNNLASAAAASGPGHMIYVLSGSGVTGPNTGITLNNNESLVGQGVDLVVTFNGTPETLYAAGTAPVIGTPVTLGQNNTIKGLNIGNSGNPVTGTGIGGSSYGTLTVSDASVTTSGGPALNLATGTLNNASFASLSSTNSSGRGLSITGSAGTLSVTNPTVINTPVTEGLFLSTNTGTFNFGGLNITNTGNTGFSASSGGTVNVTGGANTIATTTGVALNLANTTIGASGITFRSISASGAANGIVLNNTGTSGGLTVTGTGTAGSGGTIQNTSGPGILLSSATGVSLAGMIIRNGGDDGIRGTTVSGFTLANSTVQNNGNAIGSGNAGDNGLDFIDLLGTASISNSAITGSFHNNIIIRNTTGTLSGLTVTGATISNNVSTTDGDGFLFEAGGTANMSVNVSGSSFSAHQGDHFQAAALNSGVLNVIFSGNTLSGGHAAPLGQGITINASTGPPGYLGSVSYDLAGNTINGAISNAIFVGMGTSAASSSMIGKIRNNIIGTSGSALSCSTQANGVSVDARGNGTFTSAVTGNTIRQCFDRGILSEAGDGDSVLNLTVTGNTIDQQVGTLTREAIQTNHGITSTNVFGNVDTNAVCVHLAANTFSHGAGAPDDFRLRKRFEATVRLPGYAGGTGQDAGSLAQVVAFIQGQNTGSAGEPGSASASGTGGGYTGGAACPLPP